MARTEGTGLYTVVCITVLSEGKTKAECAWENGAEEDIRALEGRGIRRMVATAQWGVFRSVLLNKYWPGDYVMCCDVVGRDLAFKGDMYI
jgi:hypothetical protein